MILRNYLMTRVIVTLKTGESFDGVLARRDKRAWVLNGAKAVVNSQAAPVPVDGELIVLTENIAYAQKP